MEPKNRARILQRLNPKATRESVVRRACAYALIAVVTWGLLLLFLPRWQHSWLLLMLWVCCAAVVGAVFEWQVPNDGEDDDHSTDGRPPVTSSAEEPPILLRPLSWKVLVALGVLVLLLLLYLHFIPGSISRIE